jgi:signal transduction histidine kinase
VQSSKVLKVNNPNEEEVTINHGGQELTYKVLTAKVIDHKGQYLGVMKIFYNLTREKIIDKLKSEFISIAAHQLRTPLSAIKWVIKMILDGDVGKLNLEQEKLLFKGYQSNERIINLVNDMLNVSRIEDGRFGYSFNRDDFIEVLEAVIDGQATIMERKKIKFTLTKPKKMPLIYMDKQKIELALQNLLENAVKYTPEYGKIELAVEVGDSLVKMIIKDNGVGIPDKEQGKLFSKFFRAENVVRMQTEGSGLGLFITKNIIKKHGGEITFTSKEGKGTQFVFTLPIS